MDEPYELVFLPKKLTVRDSVTQIGNNTSKSGASILRRTTLNAGETEDLVMDQLEALQRREHTATRDFPKQVCCNNAQNEANRCFCTTILSNSQD